MLPPAELAAMRVPPHSIEAESSVLGGLLLNNGAWGQVGNLLNATDFYRYEHQLIFDAVGAIVNAGRGADVVTVYVHLERDGKHEQVGGLAYLNSLAQYVPSAGNIRRYAEIVRERSALRQMVATGEAIVASAFDLQGRTVDAVVEDAKRSICAISQNATKTESRYELLTGEQLRDLPPLAWRVQGVFPATGLGAMVGASGTAKSFLTFDAACAIAEGQRWFGYRVQAAPVVYAALEGEAGFKLRAQAWEVNRGRSLPDGLRMVLQPFKLTTQDVRELAAVVPAGAVVFIDTFNRAAPTADENSSRDMGEILEGAKLLQSLVGGLVVLIHHTGKDATKGPRGHSSLLAALDAAVEVSREGDRRQWKLAKSKDGKDGDAHAFTLRVETLGTDEYGDAITSCVVVPNAAVREVQSIRMPQGSNQVAVFDALRPMFKDGTFGKPGAPPTRPCIELEAAIRAGAAKLTCPSDKRNSSARTAIAGLQKRGVLGVHEGWLWMTT
jgi:putative DNA primase/helicase